MRHRRICIACGSGNLYKALDMGLMPNSNGFVKKSELAKVDVYPLKYYWCKECCLFQQLDIIDGKVLFKNYTYQTGASAPGVRYFRNLAKILAKRSERKRFAVVIGSNDGTELKFLREEGFGKVLGVEPARNMAMLANKAGWSTINSFFTMGLSNEIVKKHGKADIVTTSNVFAHVQDPKNMLLGMKNLITFSGLIVIEVQWFKDVFEKLSIDTLYAEHYYEWTVKAMRNLSKKCGLKLIKSEYLPDQQGGSIRFTIKLSGKESYKLEDIEKKAGIYDKRSIITLQKRSEQRKRKLVNLLKRIKQDKKSVVIWAVPAKVSTILNFCKINSDYITCAYDSTPTKIGKFIPQANIEIRDEKLLNESMEDLPNYIIIGAWNYLDFARKKLFWFTKRGGKLINMLTGEVIS